MTLLLRLSAVILVGAAACTGTITGDGVGGGGASSAGGGGGGGGGGGVGGGGDPTGPDAGTTSTVPGQGAVARGMEWVNAQVPYCQSPNGQPDGDASCSATCERPDVPAWNAYRSDCSGFVSWAWDLPAPGRTTGDFAPFTTDITEVIDSSELRPGDAINNDEHIMMFVAWTQVGSEATFIQEPGCSASPPYASQVTLSVTTNGSTVSPQYYGDFTAIRYDQAP